MGPSRTKEVGSERIRPARREEEFRHSVIAFGGGVLFAAIALILAPEGARHLPVWATLAAFGAGGLSFFLIDRAIARHGGTAAQFMAMLLDFLPESLAMGAMLAAEESIGILLAVLVTLQNLPEGFNAYRELATEGKHRPGRVLAGFCLLVPLGPLAAWVGYSYLRTIPEVLGVLTLFAARGILYLTFEDIAPQVHLERRWGPPLGAVAGFMLGLLGDALVT